MSPTVRVGGTGAGSQETETSVSEAVRTAIRYAGAQKDHLSSSASLGAMPMDGRAV